MRWNETKEMLSYAVRRARLTLKVDDRAGLLRSKDHKLA